MLNRLSDRFGQFSSLTRLLELIASDVVAAHRRRLIVVALLHVVCEVCNLLLLLLLWLMKMVRLAFVVVHQGGREDGEVYVTLAAILVNLGRLIRLIVFT